MEVWFSFVIPTLLIIPWSERIEMIPQVLLVDEVPLFMTSTKAARVRVR